MLFETAWREGYEYYERVKDTTLGRSVKQQIRVPHEWYEPSTNGLYSCITDSELKLEKKQGRANQGREFHGFTDPIYRTIRDKYWKDQKYNTSPRIWYLDIETRSGRSYKNPGVGSLRIRKIGTETVLELPTQEVQRMFYNTGEEHFEFLERYKDENNPEDVFEPLSSNFYMERNKGFPVPGLALEEVSLIQIFDSELKEIIMIGTREWKHREDYEDRFEYPLRYIVANSEKHLFQIYNEIFSRLNPLIVYAWNGLGFDYPYLFNRMKRLGMDPNSMSNYGEVKLTESDYAGRSEYILETPGHYYLDMMEVYRKFVLAPRSSYALDNIAEVELKENKVQHSEYAQFDHFYLGLYNVPKEPTQEQKDSKIYQLAVKEGITEEVRELGHSEFCWYAYKDPLLIMKLDQKLNLTALAIETSQRMGVQIPDSFGTVRPWSQYIANVAIQRNKVMPPRTEHDHPNVVGGYVMEPVRGKKKWILSADFSSMYPNNMIAYNMSPETFKEIHEVPGELKDIILGYFNSQDESKVLEFPEEVWNACSPLLKKNSLSLGINGAVFSTEEVGILPELISEIYQERTDTRKLEGRSKSMKMLVEDVIHSIDEGTEAGSRTNPCADSDYTREELLEFTKDSLVELARIHSEKERQFWTKQTGLKLIINSLYGALANKYFPLFNESMARAITGNGRFIIRLLAKNIENQLQGMIPSEEPYILYSDTDSAYLQIEPFVNKFLEKNPESSNQDCVDFCDKFFNLVIEKIIESTISEVSEKLNMFNPSVIKADREVIADSGVFVQKKKYMIRVRDNEGFRFPEYDPEIKVMGLDLIKSSTPNWSKVKLQESVSHILDKDEASLRSWVNSVKSEYLDVDLNDIAISGGVNNIDYKLGEKGIPFGARSALIHNKYVQENSLEGTYAPIEAGDKCKRLYLNTPNKFGSNIVAYTNDLFVREVQGLVDYDTMFEKGFFNSIENITLSMGYNLRKETESLDDW